MRHFALFLALGLGLWACQDQVVDPEAADLEFEAAFAKGGIPGKPGGEGGGEGTLTLADALTGTGQEDMEWSVKKGVFKAYATMEVKTHFSFEDEDKGDCRAIPDWNARADELWEKLKSELTGKAANVHVDIENPDGPSELHRVFSRVEGEVVRYFWVGPRYQFEGMFPDDPMVSVAGFDLEESPIEYALSGGIVGVRDTGPPSRVVLIGCPFDGQVFVTVTK